MHDETPLTIGRVARVLNERVRPAIYSAATELDVAAHVLPGEPIAPSEGLELDYEPFAVGSEWGRAWGTTWFRVRGSVPADWAGKRVEVRVDLGFDERMPGFQAEALVYRGDGSPVKSINPRNQWLLVADPAVGGEEIEYFLEAASNPVLLGDNPFRPSEEGDILTASPRLLYRLARVEAAVFETEVYELAGDLDILLELQEELPPTQPRRMQILQALDNALDVLDLQHIPDTASAARAELAHVLAAPATSSAHRVAAIGHAHIDSAWLWPVRETIRKAARTVASMTNLIEEEDDFLYGMSSAQQYAWIKEHRPRVYAKLKQAVAEGRFIPIGGMWVESDTVMPTGESLVRQFLYGQRFFESEFGMRSQGVWLPDSFGYSPALPQLIRRAGFEWFFTQKISWNQVNKFPHHTFLWEGIDGSRTFTHFPPMDTYNSQLSGEEMAKANRQFRENRLARGSIAPVGWGDGGGGTTREMVGRARRLENLEGSPKVAWVRPADFYEQAKRELPNPPVWVGELYLELHRGTLTSQHGTKAGNRRAEHAMVEAELWATTAHVQLGRTYPAAEFDELWQQVLLHQFHDILPGTSIAWVHREAEEALARVAERAGELAAEARAALAGSGERELVFTPFSGPDAASDGLDGGQEGESHARRIAPISATEASFAKESSVELSEESGGYNLENELVSVRVDATGLITSAIDKTTGRDAIPAGRPANVFQLHQDFPNMWDAWDIDRYYRNTVEDLTEVDAIEARIDDGAATVVIRRTFSDSSLVQTLRLQPGQRTLELENDVDWHECEKLLKLAFPLDLMASSTEAETQFGYQSRPTHVNTSWEAAKFETSMHRFVRVAEADFGIGLINDSIYGYDTTRDATPEEGVTTTIRASLLRAPRFPDPETDQGRHVITLGLVIGGDMADVTGAAIALNSPATVVRGAHEVDPLVQVSSPGVVISAVKMAADGTEDVIVRVYEALGKRTKARVQPCFEYRSIGTATLIEDPLGNTGADEEGADVEFALTPFEVRTLRIRR